MSISPSQQRRHEEKERRREEIIDAAEWIFERHGFDAATMDQVARRARVSRALVYVYFKDKTALHAAICVRALTLLRARFVTAVGQQARGIDQVRAIGRAYMQFAVDEPGYFQTLSRFEAHCVGEADEDSPTKEIISVGRTVHEVTVSAIVQGMTDGSMRADIENPLLVAITLWGFTHGVVQIAHTKGEAIRAYGMDVDALLDHALDLASRALATSRS
jgi:TetR/AcrR family transcriptional regulator